MQSDPEGIYSVINEIPIDGERIAMPVPHSCRRESEDFAAHSGRCVETDSVSGRSEVAHDRHGKEGFRVIIFALWKIRFRVGVRNGAKQAPN